MTGTNRLDYPERERCRPEAIRRKESHLSGHYPDASSGALSAEALRTSLSGISGRLICEGLPVESV